jgi:hypothetical protein
MSIFDPDTIPEQFITSMLQGNPEIVAIIGTNTVTDWPQIYHSNAPEEGRPPAPTDGGPPPPFIIYYAASGMVPNRPVGKFASWWEGTWGVKAAGRQDNQDTVRRLHQLIIQTLDNASGDTVDGRVVSCQADGTIPETPETRDGVVYIQRGSIFRITAQPCDTY